MASGPYQSTALRFFVSQYRQGRDRHRRAVLQTRSNIALGGKISVAVVRAPVDVIVQASRAIRQKLTQSVRKLQLSATRTKVKRLIDFSPFKALSSASPDSQPHQSAKEAERTPAICALALVREIAEASMLQALVAVSDSLLPAQIDSLAEIPANRRLPANYGWGLIRRSVHRLVSVADNLVELTVAHRITFKKSQKESQITGIACDLKTRSLVLILGYTEAWNGLNPTQQAYIRSLTSRFFEENSMTAASSTRSTTRLAAEARSLRRYVGKSPSIEQSKRPVGSIVQPIYSFWIAVLKVIGGLQRKNHRQPAAFLSSGLHLPGLRWLAASVSQVRLASNEVLRLMGTPSCSPLKPSRVSAIAKRILPSTKMILPNVCGEVGLLNRQQADYPDSNYWLEASVVSVDYVEHPLEKLLKWVDRILLWIERRWQILLEWRRDRYSSKPSTDQKNRSQQKN